MNTINTTTPELPEGFELYGMGPLKVPSQVPSPDIIFWDPAWGTYGWDRSNHRGSVDFAYYALRIGSEIWKVNWMEKGDIAAEKPLLLVTDEMDELQAAVSSPAYKQLEGEFIQQRDELAAARNRIVDLENAHAREVFTVRNLERLILAEANDAAQRIINLQDECGRLTELWHGAEGRLALMAEARNNALASAQEWETACREKADELDAARRESTNCILLNRIEEACRERDALQEKFDTVCSTIKSERDNWQKDHMEMKRRLDAAEARAANNVAGFAYGDLVTKLAKVLGMPSMEIPLGEVLERVEELKRRVDNQIGWKGHYDSLKRQADTKVAELEAKLDSFQSNSKLARMYLETKEQAEVLQKRVIALDNERSVAQRERDNWEQTAAQHLRNEHFYRDLLGQCAELLGDECRRSDDGKLIPKGDFLALKVPEVLKERLENKKSIRALVATELGKATNNILKGL